MHCLMLLHHVARNGISYVGYKSSYQGVAEKKSDTCDACQHRNTAMPKKAPEMSAAQVRRLTWGEDGKPRYHAVGGVSGLLSLSTTFRKGTYPPFQSCWSNCGACRQVRLPHHLRRLPETPEVLRLPEGLALPPPITARPDASPCETRGRAGGPAPPTAR